MSLCAEAGRCQYELLICLLALKRIKYIVFIVLLALTACEVIKEEDRLIPLPQPTASERVHVLIEYTGFRCVNCPTAAELAHQLQQLYAGQLIVVAMHPPTNHFTQGLYDYTCPEADVYYTYMGGTATTSFPKGNIDLQAVDNDYLLDPSVWATQLEQVMKDTLCPYLSCTAEADTTLRTLSIVTKYSLNGDAQVALWLIEDSISGVQAMPDGSVNMDYTHRHVLRGAANNAPWGVPAVGQKMKTEMPLPTSCNPQQCSIVALLLDKNDYHILQAYETKLTFFSVEPALP